MSVSSLDHRVFWNMEGMMADLFLFALAGRLHAVCGILRTEEIGSVFHLPLHPPQMAGLTLIDDNTITLADLAACLGYPGQSRNSCGTALLLSEDDEIGFLVAEFVHRETVPPQNLLQVPDSLLSPLISRCALIEGEPIPLIDLCALRARLEEGHWAPPEVALKLAPHTSRHLEPCNEFRLLHLGGEPFALPETDLQVLAEAVIKVCSFGKTQPFLGGLGCTGDGLRPAVHLEPLLGLPPAPSSQVPFLGQVAEHEVIFFADHLAEKTFAAQQLLALPPLAQRRGMRHALMAEGRVIPILDLPDLLEEGLFPPPGSERYGTEDADTGDPEPSFQEFSLLGARFAVPKVEVETVLPLLPMRSIPSDLPLLRGIAEHRGALWPVLDLAPYFGRHIPPDKCDGLMAVQRGDFRALLMAEEIFGEVRPDRKSRRELPLSLAQHLVYDCYLQAEEVIVVLNVKGMALNFDPVQAKICQDAIKVEEPAKDAALALSLAESGEEENKAVRDPWALEEEEGETLPLTAVAEELPRAERGPAIPEAKEETQSPALHMQSALPCSEPESAQEELIPAEPSLQVNQESTAHPAVKADADTESETTDLSALETLSGGDKGRELLPAEEIAESPPAPCDSEALEEGTTTSEREDPTPEVNASPASGAVAEYCSPPAAFSLIRPYGEPPSIPPIESGPRPVPQREVLPSPVPIAAATPDAAPSMKKASGEPEDLRLIAPAEPVGKTDLHPHQDARKQGSSRRLRRVAVLASLLAALAAGGSTLFFVADRPEEAGPRSVAAQNKKQPAGLTPEAEPLPPVRGAIPLPAPSSPAAVGTVLAPGPVSTPKPPAAPAEEARTTAYRVVPGDTLWDIAHRSTGDPFSYRRIASDNAIPNPNLIHPGQEISLP